MRGLIEGGVSLRVGFLKFQKPMSDWVGHTLPFYYNLRDELLAIIAPESCLPASQP